MALDMSVGVGIKANVQGGQAVDRLNQQLKQLGTQGQLSARQLAQAYQQIPAQLQDVAVSLAGGQNPLMVLLQQGSQVATQFGGVGNAFRALGAIITPTRLAFGGLAVAVGTLGKAYYDSQKETDDFNKAMALTGNLAGINFARFQQLSSAMTNIGGSIGSNKDLLMGALGTGVFGSLSLEPAVMAMARFRDITGQTSEEVVKHFSAMANGVANWAGAQNRAMGYLTAEQFRYIRQLEQQGRAEEAMAYNMNLLDKALEARKPQLSTIGQLFKGIAKEASAAWDAMKNLMYNDTSKAAADEISALEKRIADAMVIREKIRKSGGYIGPESEELKASRARLEELKRQQKEQQDVLEKDAAVRAKNRKDVERESSGLAQRVSNALMDRELADLKANYDEKRRLLQYERENKESEKKRELISDRTFAEYIGDIRKRELEAEREYANERKKVAERRPMGDEAQNIARAQKIKEAEAEVNRIKSEQGQNSVRLGREILEIEDRKSKALRYYTEDLRHQNEMLALEAYKIEMTDFAYKQLVDTKQREYDIKVKTRGMTVEEAAQYAAAANAAGELKAQLEQVNFQQSRTFEYGAKTALKNYVDEAGNAAKQIESALSSAFRATENTLTDFIVKGKADFGELAQSIASDFVKMALRMFVMKPLLDAVSSFLPGSGFPGISLSTPTVTGARAGGGQVSSGGTYLVGENGPEILKLGGQGGNITPTHNLGGGTNVVINNYSNANASARETVDSRGNRRIEVTVGEMVASELRRAGSSTFNAVRETFGTSPALVGR